ncbi:hypothetical protein CK203_045668 [Vitis vinifera]|uniref:Uncharacterized protein n=1 Tax=Vitis vinifera TaxID=29760 RepID=A0A438HQ86_VITVI|nr:hypothetical protein CK203_045668 [Vitis vinifera]
MPDIERYTGIGCPRIHLQLCTVVMHGHRPSMALRRVYLEDYGQILLLRLKGKKLGSGPRPSYVGTIGMMGHRSLRRPQTQRQFSENSYQMIQHDQYRPTIPIRLVGLAYLHPSPQPVYATKAFQRPPMQFISIEHRLHQGQLDSSHSLGCH